MKCTLHLHLVLIVMKLCASLGRYKQIVIAPASCSYFFLFGLFTVHGVSFSHSTVVSGVLVFQVVKKWGNNCCFMYVLLHFLICITELQIKPKKRY